MMSKVKDGQPLLIRTLTKFAARKRAEIPKYSFQKHQREADTTTIYSPHVLVLEGIFALHDSRVLDLLDLKVSAGYDDV